MSGSKSSKKAELAKAAEAAATSPDTAKLMAAIANLEKTVVEKISTLEAKVESKCQTLYETIDSLPLVNKTEDLEGRQRRCNIRILGVREQFETGTRPVACVAKLLQELLSLDAAPTLDAAHRSLQPAPVRGQRPRPLIVKFHYNQEKLEVLRKAARNGPLLYNNDKILIFPDLPPTVVRRRGAFKDVKELLRGCQDVRYGMLYPAKLRISSPLGEKFFTDPVAAKDYTMKHLLGPVLQHLLHGM
uniref:Transposase n=1 Tax=Gouania willdenowi TaxID=441366 RepID=A0A8C5ER82_GOUWI